MATGLNETVELRPRSCDFNAGQGDSVKMRWTFPDAVDVTEWSQAIVTASAVVTFDLLAVDGDDASIDATLTRTKSATIANGSHRWYLRHIDGTEQRSYKGRWVVT